MALAQQASHQTGAANLLDNPTTSAARNDAIAPAGNATDGAALPRERPQTAAARPAAVRFLADAFIAARAGAKKRRSIHSVNGAAM